MTTTKKSNTPTVTQKGGGRTAIQLPQDFPIDSTPMTDRRIVAAEVESFTAEDGTKISRFDNGTVIRSR